ncbi:MAG: AAA family ATPase, partial [Cyanophyceae cyanobacterium]
MTTLTGYTLGEALYEGARTQVYRATRRRDRHPVVIKMLRTEYPSFRELLQFRNQYTIAKNLDLPGIVQPLSLENHGNGYAMVMGDEGYISLSQWRSSREWELGTFLKIGIQLAGVLHGLYQNRVIHKDIKPPNILIHPTTEDVKLIDFSISSLLPKETQEISNPNGLEGTLAYLSPEQTGRMNRGIDYRTDFYSLGVTFYELLTGQLPFQSGDPMELVHCHIAQSPTLPDHIQPIPAVIFAIIRKLMAKNTEDRYQSALGLKYDLERCLQSLNATGEISEFELGERDICDRFNIPEKLYGRETEVQTLLNSFERVSSGSSEMLLVAGFSGIGKTALVNEVHKPIVEKRGYFIKGKFDQFNRNIPFSALVQAFRGLMGQLLSESDKDLAKWRSKILDAVGENGQVLVEVIPELEQVIGPQAGATELSGTASQNRFNLLFQKFIAVFTTPEHPLVMFLDDLQWADSASLNLMKVLLRECENEHLLLLGAYRDNEVFPAHPLMLTLDELVKESAEISTIMLAPLPITEINRLVAETLSCSSELAKPLTELVYQKTNGNPFFTTQFLKGIHEDDLIVFDRDLGYWRGDLARVRDAVLTDDVVEFMAERLLKLPQETQDVLKLAACIGNQFDLDTLAVVCKKSTETVAADLWEALREGLILSITDTYKFFQSGIPDEEYLGDILVGYRFLHERVQQAAYSLIPKVECDQTHLLLGQLLLENVTGLPLKSYSPQLQPDIENIFNIINQLNAGASLLSDRQEKETLSFLNLQAGRKAKVSTAYTTALNYIEQFLALLDEDPLEDQYKLCLSLTDLAAELAYLCGDFQRMHHWVMVIREHAQTLLDRIKADGIEIQGLMARCQFSEEMELTCHVLQLLGIELPQQISSEDIDSALARVRSQLGSRSIASLATLNEMEEPEKCAAMGILLAAIPAAYIINPPLFLLMVLQQMSLSLGYGHSAISPFAFAAYGIVRCGIEADVIGGYEFGMLAIEILSARQRSRHDPDIRAIVTYAFHTFLSHWCVPLRESLSGLKQVYRAHLRSLRICVKLTGEVNFSNHDLFKQFDRCRMGNPRASVARGVA